MDKFSIDAEKRLHAMTELLILSLVQSNVTQSLIKILLAKTSPQAAAGLDHILRDMRTEEDAKIRNWIFEVYGPDLGHVSAEDRMK